jgi:hypothetical protein
VLRTPHRRHAYRPAIRELRAARGVDAHRTGRQLRHVPVERAASQPRKPVSQRGGGADARIGVAQPEQERRQDAARCLRARRTLRGRPGEDRARQPAGRAQHVHRKPRPASAPSFRRQIRRNRRTCHWWPASAGATTT